MWGHGHRLQKLLLPDKHRVSTTYLGRQAAGRAQLRSLCSQDYEYKSENAAACSFCCQLQPKLTCLKKKNEKFYVRIKSVQRTFTDSSNKIPDLYKLSVNLTVGNLS